MKAKHIHITGIVQGVGFRPLVYRLARIFDITGWVSNASDGVHIHGEGRPVNLNDFINTLKDRPPKEAFIQHMDIREVAFLAHSEFVIAASDEHRERSVLPTPDYGMCRDCEQELFDPHNRRYRYPFITCTLCGPRYSIIRKLPFDRPQTVMAPYPMCHSCQEEYDQVLDRRYYAQTNSCSACGFHLRLFDQTGEIKGTENYSSDEIIYRIICELESGKIIGLKGIGGYLLMCDATNKEAIRTLRTRKNRPAKPFALVYPDLAMLTGDVVASDIELKEYQSVEAPIVLFRKQNSPLSGVQAEEVAPGLGHIGVMRAYAPLLALIIHDFNKPMVATSGNISGETIIYEDDDAIQHLTHIADLVLVHNRDILLPEDDSVLRITNLGRKILIRRSRGYAPNYLKDIKLHDSSVLALGGELKGAFSLRHGQNTYISQYLGDQSSYDAQLNYQHTLEHLMDVLDFNPEVILGDAHPGYHTTRLGEDLAKSRDIPLCKVQHHEAHFAAVLGENELIDTSEPILGVIWDGTGYGSDQQVWGGEFFTYDNYTFRRSAHLQYYTHLLGDKMAREPRLSALSILAQSPQLNYIASRFTDDELKYYRKLTNKYTLNTSSIGRLFDATASVLDLCDKMSYEGEGAMLLEELASNASHLHDQEVFTSEELLSPVFHLEQLIRELKSGWERSEVAWNFHVRLVQLVRCIARDLDIKILAFSGGVFQNGLLVDLIEQHLGHDHELCFHQLLSPNDENIGFGQLMHHEIRVRRTLKSKTHELENVL